MPMKTHLSSGAIKVRAGSETYGYNPQGLHYQPRIGMDDYRPVHVDSKITYESNTTEFDPKAYDSAEWCPIYQIGKTEAGGDVWFCSLNDSIDVIHEYIPLLDKLYNCTDKDAIELNISSPGGYISTATQICTAMHACRALVLTHASGLCASAGSLIWSCGHEVSIGDYANFMWHMSSHQDYGNSLQIYNEAEFQINYVRNTLLSIALKRGFITEDEVAKICTTPDEAIYISAEKMRERIMNLNAEGGAA